MKLIKDAEYIAFSQILGGNIRFCRLRNFKPQKSLAYAIGVSHQNIQNNHPKSIIFIKKVIIWHPTQVAEKLTDLAVYYGFDGWLVNIESAWSKIIKNG